MLSCSDIRFVLVSPSGAEEPFFSENQPASVQTVLKKKIFVSGCIKSVLFVSLICQNLKEEQVQGWRADFSKVPGLIVALPIRKEKRVSDKPPSWFS